MAAIGAMPVVGAESKAGTLANSIRAGDRSRMHIVRAPAPGTVRPPLPSARVRVLTPEAAPARAAPATRSHRRPPPGPQDWFWARHTPARAAAAPGRWVAALADLRVRRAGGEGFVSDATVRLILRAHGPTIEKAAARHAVSNALIAAVIAVESAGRAGAISHAGAQGLMQLIPATARRFGVDDSFDPIQNVEGGTAYLSWLLNRFEQDPILALAGYNAGEGAVDKHAGVPPYKETRAYVVKVFDAMAAIERFCAARPASPRHPCDWSVATAAAG
ncbi:MAG: lytic transglycosylase domain-containing protein [Paracoccaceae bacterium]